MRRALRSAAASALSILSIASIARAADVPCSAVEADVIHVDGLLDDWSDVSGIDIGGRDHDFSFSAKCNYDDKALYFAVDVRDDYLVRTRDARPVEDHLELAFASGGKVERLAIWPGDGAAKRKVSWSDGRKVAGIEVADARQAAGWAVEVRMALASVPGWTPGAPSIRLAIAATDCDSKARPAVEARLESSPTSTVATLGTIEFAEAKRSFEAFLKELHLSPRDVVFDRPARVATRGQARVIVAGSYLAVISDEYAYIALPIKDRRDLKEVQLMDLAGDGRQAVVVRYLERGGGGSREVLAAYRMTLEGLRRTFGVEVAKAQGPNRLATRVSFPRRGRGAEIVVEAQPAVGWTEASYREAAADDVVPIPTPWTQKRARFQFKGDDYLRVE